MTKLNLKHIERGESISKQDFVNQYYKKQKPLTVEKLTEDWPAYNKWNPNSQPTNLRISLYNIMKEVPTLQNDFKWPDIDLKSIYNVTCMRYFTILMRHLQKQKWIDYKNEQAIIKSHKNI